MLKAVKGNKEYIIDEREKDTLIAQGYSIIEVSDKGKVKTVHDADAKTDDSKALKEATARIDALEKEVEELTVANTKLAEEKEALAKEVEELKKKK